MLPKKEKGPVDHTKDEIDFELVVKNWVEEISVIDKVDDRLGGEKEEGKNESQVKKSSNF